MAPPRPVPPLPAPCFVQSVPLLTHPLPTRLTSPYQGAPPAAPRRRPPPRCTPTSCTDAADFVPLPPPSIPSPPPSALPSSTHLLTVLWRFSRPHTIYGTLLSVSSISTLAALTARAPLSPAVLPAFLTALIPALLLNVYIVGLNQLYDVEIDRINKPLLPLPAGQLSIRHASAIVAVALVGGLSFCAAPLATPALRAVLLGSTLLGTLYSVPPFRLKRFALLASVAILSVRGVLVNVGFFWHLASLMGVVSFPPIAAFATVFFMLFGVVIALLKDAPDIRGDRIFGIRTFSVRLGAPAIFNACATTLVAMFSMAAVYYFRVSRTLVGGILSALAHVLVAIVLGVKARKVNTESSSEIYQFYMSSWKAFYLEYLLLPLATL